MKQFNVCHIIIRLLLSSSLHFSKFGTIDYLISVQFARQIKLPGSNMLVQYTQTLFYNTLWKISHFDKKMKNLQILGKVNTLWEKNINVTLALDNFH